MTHAQTDGLHHRNGYATTVHQSQGKPVDRSFVLASPTMDRQLTHVAMTRHRDAAEPYADGQALSGQNGLADRPAELKIRAACRSPGTVRLRNPLRLALPTA